MLASPLRLTHIQNLVGDISEADLACVDCYLSTHLGIFIPGLGHCGLFFRPQHTHPSHRLYYFQAKSSVLKI